MLVHKKGDLLEATEDIICHQCNTEGIFGGGLALQIKGKYPECEQETIEFVSSIKEGNVIGACYLYEAENYTIANCFSQNPDFTTNYEALKAVFTSLLKKCSEENKSIAMPYMYGCGIADGNWLDIQDILMDLSDQYGVDISVYELEEI